MKKFTRLWQLLIVFALSSGVVFAQEANVTAKQLNNGSNAELILKKKQESGSIQSLISSEKPAVLSQGEQEDLMIKEALLEKQALKQMTTLSGDRDPKAGNAVGSPSEFLFDFQFEVPLVNPSGTSVGLETDGNYIYTCHWQHDTIYRYDMGGTLVGWFIIPGVSLMRDMTYDGTYFYGAAAATAVWQMDFTLGAEMLVSTITAPTACRGIGYDDVNGYLFGNNWSTDIVIFDMTGAMISSFTPNANSYYGFAFDNYTAGGPYIWGHAQMDVSLEWLVQMNYPSGAETGIQYDIGVALGHVGGNAGGLAITPPGTFPSVDPLEWSIFGIAQNVSLWAVELDEPNPCSTPVTLGVANITGVSADLSWTETGTATSWEVEYGVAGFVTGSGTSITPATNPQAIAGLTPVTAYEFQVRADCGGGSYSGWSSRYAFATAGDCEWTIDGADSYGDGWNGASLAIVVDGVTVLNFSVPVSAASAAFPMLDPATVDLVWTAGTYDSECSYEVYDNTGVLVFSEVAPPVGTTGITGYCSVITCDPPTGLYTNNITETGAQANWLIGTGTLWNLEYGPAGFATGTGTTVTGIIPPTFGNPNSPITGLTPGGSYDWYVQTDCGGGDVSSWVGPINFVTPCATFPVPFVESFDVQADPACWVNTSSNPVSNGLWEYGQQGNNPAGWGASLVDDHTGNGGFFAWSDGSTPEVADITLTSPMIDPAGLTTPYLSFYVWSNNEDNPGDNVPLYVNFWDGAAWNAVTTYAADNIDWVFVGLDLSAYTITGDVQFQFITDQVFPTNDAFYNDILIDDIFFGELPLCPSPIGQGVENPTATGLDLVWTSLSGVSNVEYGATGFAMGTGTMLTGVTSPQTVALTSGDTYDFYVQDVCGGDLSAWVGPYTFTYYTPPANDECVNAELVPGPYPYTATGTTLGATIDCPGVLDWNAVWYEVTLPYGINDLHVDYCGTADQATMGIVYYADCSDCGAYTIADAYSFYDCGTPGGVTVGQMDFLNITGPTTIMFPVYQDPLQDFIVNFDVTEVVPTYLVSGTMTYTGGTAMDAVTVNLMDGAILIDTDLTDGAGYFEFMDVPDGSYTYESATSKIWAGLNVVDIIFTKLRLANISPPVWDPIMSELAADVNIPSGLNVVDLLMMQLRSANLTAPAWNNDDWLFEPVPVTVAGAAVVQDVRSICGGDVNFDYTPASQLPANDACSNPEAVVGPYPVTGIDGSTVFATNDCPVYLPQVSGEVWYAIDLPYAQNDVVLGYCGDADMNNGYVIGTLVQCSCTDTDYLVASSWNFAAPCVTDLTWFNVAGPGTFYYPVSTGDFQEHFLLDVDVTESAPGYCVAGSGLEDEFVLNLTCGTIVDGPNVADGVTYHDRTAMTTDLGIGVGAALSFDNGTPYTSDQGTVWVDWNQDLDFDDAGEMFTLVDTNLDGSLFDGVIIPPVGAILGTTRMRVRVNYTALAEPCGSPSYGEVVDYSVNVTP